MLANLAAFPIGVSACLVLAVFAAPFHSDPARRRSALTVIAMLLRIRHLPDSPPAGR